MALPLLLAAAAAVGAYVWHQHDQEPASQAEPVLAAPGGVVYLSKGGDYMHQDAAKVRRSVVSMLPAAMVPAFRMSLANPSDQAANAFFSQKMAVAAAAVSLASKRKAAGVK